MKNSSPPSLHELDLVEGLRPIRPEPPQVVGRLEIHPLVLQGEPGAPYLLLHEALASGALEVSETERGTVNELIARNRGDRPVLILEGESVQGAKQNRLVTVDLLLAAGGQVSFPVGCVEQGRWDKSKAGFVASEMAAEPELRRAARVGRSPKGIPDQVKLWRAVASKLGGSDTSSATSDYLAKMKRFRGRVAEIAQVLKRTRDQVGLLATERGRLVGLDLLGHPSNWAAVSERLSHSYVLGSLHADEESDGAQPARTAADWLEAIARANPLPAVTEGLGTRFSLDDATLVGGGLWHEGRVAHLAAFGFTRSAEHGGWVAG